jgi:hypothetical protein
MRPLPLDVRPISREDSRDRHWAPALRCPPYSSEQGTVTDFEQTDLNTKQSQEFAEALRRNHDGGGIYPQHFGVKMVRWYQMPLIL